MFYSFTFAVGFLILFTNFIGFPTMWKEIIFIVLAILLIVISGIAMLRVDVKDDK